MEIDQKRWDLFVKEALREFDEKDQTNVRFPFPVLCRKYGAAYREYLRILLCDLKFDLRDVATFNGYPPIGFLEKIQAG